ncbi:hypothetical protein ACTFIY_001655 [Dictyostelium cf. discoideum]
MATTLFSLLDLLASRFRSDSQEGQDSQEGENTSALSIQVSESEPQSQPRSRSHTEVSRPPNLPTNNNNNNNNNHNNNPNRVVRPNRSPIQTRQQRSHTTALDPNGLPPGVGVDPNLLSPQTRQQRSGSQLRPNNLNRDPSRRNSTNLPRRPLSTTLQPINNTTPTTTSATTKTETTPSTLEVPTIPIDSNNNNNNNNENEQPKSITLQVPTIVELQTPIQEEINLEKEKIGPSPIPNFNTPSNLLNTSYAAGTVLVTPPLFTSNDPMNSSKDGIEMKGYGDGDDQDEYGDEDQYDEYDDADRDDDQQNKEDIEQPIEALEEKKEPLPPFSHKDFIRVFGTYFLKILGLTLAISIMAVGYGCFEIFLGCRYIDTSSATWPYWAIVTHSISRTILNFSLCMFPYFLLLTFFGFRDTIVPLIIGLISSSGASAWAIYNTVHELLDQTLALLPSYFFFCVALVLSSHYMGRKINDPTFRHLFMGQFALAAIVLVLYDFAILPWYVKTSSINKSVVRILIHPGLCAMGLFVARACSSRIKPKTPGTNVFPVLIFMWFSTYYGRFFNSNMSLLFMSGTMAIVSLTELLWRTTLRPRDKKIMNAICGFCFKKRLTHSQNFDKIYRDFLRHEQLYENTSILTSCFVYIAFYNVFDKSQLDYTTLFSSMAIQFSFEWVTDIISMYIETRIYKIEALHWKNPPKYFYFMLLYTFFLGMSYSTSRVILLGEGKWFNQS